MINQAISSWMIWCKLTRFNSTIIETSPRLTGHESRSSVRVYKTGHATNGKIMSKHLVNVTKDISEQGMVKRNLKYLYVTIHLLADPHYLNLLNHSVPFIFQFFFYFFLWRSFLSIPHPSLSTILH